jgi:hypothetical protein
MFSGEEVRIATSRLSQVEDSSFRWVLGPDMWLGIPAFQLSTFMFACNRGGAFEVF